MQIRSESFAAVLAAICIASPTIEARLKELEPGRGRQAAPQQVQGASSIFAIAASLPEEQKQVHLHSLVMLLCLLVFQSSVQACSCETVLSGACGGESLTVCCFDNAVENAVHIHACCVSGRSLHGCHMLCYGTQTHAELWYSTTSMQLWREALWAQQQTKEGHLLNQRPAYINILRYPSLSQLNKVPVLFANRKLPEILRH